MNKDMKEVGWRVYANKQPWAKHVGLWFVSHEPPSFRPALIVDYTVEYQEEGFSMPPEPTMRLHDDVAQALVNQLWDMGIRPAQAQQGPDSGVQKHLEDMRVIAFHKLGIQRG